MAYECNGATIETDESGYLKDSSTWSIDLALLIASKEGIDMQDEHWQIVSFMRDYFAQHQKAPAMRVLTQAIRKKLGPEKATSKHLYRLFPYGPTTQGSKIAGLPKPVGCI